MKKLIVLLAGLTVAGAVHAGDMSADAEFRLRWKMDVNRSGAKIGSEDRFDHRMKLGKAFKANDQISANFTLVHNAQWGVNSAAEIGGPNSASPNNFVGDNGLTVNEAYMTWQVSDDLQIKAGRGSFEMADGSVIARNDYQNVMTAFEGVAAVYEMEMFRLSGWGVRFADLNRTQASGDTEANSIGLSFDFKNLPDFMKMGNFHLIQNNNNAITGVRAQEKVTRAGLTVGGDFAEMFDYRLTYAMETGDVGVGTTQDVETSMLDTEFGFSMPDTMNLRFYVGYHMDSGADASTTGRDTYSSFYYDIHKNAGLMDIVGWGNLTYLKVGFTLDPMENFNLGVHYHMFTATEEAGATVGTNFSSATNTLVAAGSTEDDIGSEIDVTMMHKYDNGLEFGLRFSQFMYGDRFGTGLEDHQQVWFQSRMSF